MVKERVRASVQRHRAPHRTYLHFIIHVDLRGRLGETQGNVVKRKLSGVPDTVHFHAAGVVGQLHTGRVQRVPRVHWHQGHLVTHYHLSVKVRDYFFLPCLRKNYITFLAAIVRIF